MNPADQVRKLLLPLRVIMIAIAVAILFYIGFGYAVSNGFFPGLHLPLLRVKPDVLRLMTTAGMAVAAVLVGVAVQWERFNMAPERLAQVRGEDAVRALLTRVYVFQAVLLETAGVIGLVLLFAGLSFEIFLLFAAVPLLLLSFKITHLDDLVPTLGRLL